MYMNTDDTAVAVARSLSGNQVLATNDGPAKGTIPPIPFNTEHTYDNLFVYRTKLSHI